MSTGKKVDKIFASLQAELAQLQGPSSMLDDERRLRKLSEYRPFLRDDTAVVPKSRNWKRSRDKVRLFLHDAYTACGKDIVCLCVLASSIKRLAQLNGKEIKLLVERLKNLSISRGLPRLSSFTDTLFNQELEKSFKSALTLPRKLT